MLNLKIIFKIIGQLLFIESLMFLSCLIMSICYQEDDTFAFLISITITTLCGILFKFLGRKAENTLNRRDAYLVVTLTWIIFSLFGTFPFIISGYLTNFAGAYLETMSGFTTTGASVIDNVDIFPHALLFWRSMTHWIGGLGIVFFTVAVLPSLVGGSVKVFTAESTGPIKSKLHPRLSTTAKWIWMVYLVLTAACVLSFWIGGMGFFDSVNYSMAITATGGFSTHSQSIAYFNSPTIEYIGIVFQFLSGMNFTLIYLSIFKGKFSLIPKNSEFKFYTILVLISTAWIAVLLVRYNHYDVSHAIRSSMFQVVSLITTTGMYSDNAGLWPHMTWLILSICMFFGACAGSTSGGLKCIRGVMIMKVIRNEFLHILHPKAVLPIRIDGENVLPSAVPKLMAFFALYILLCLLGAVYMISMGIESTDAVTISLSSLSNVGPALGNEISPISSWSPLPDSVKWVCSALMLLGRLEIFTVLVIFTPGFWKDN